MDSDDPVPGGQASEGASETAVPADDHAPTIDGSSARLRIIVVFVAVAVLVVAITGVVLFRSSTPTTVSTGSGTATITWVPVRDANANNLGNPPQPFAGTIDGIPVSGVATTPLTTANGSALTSPSALSSKIQFFRWKGVFGGKAFNVGLFGQYHHLSASTNPAVAFPTITIVGKWGVEPVNGRIRTPSAAELNSGTGPLDFYGTVGELKVSGKVTNPTGSKKRQSGMATFTVSR